VSRRFSPFSFFLISSLRTFSQTLEVTTSPFPYPTSPRAFLRRYATLYPFPPLDHSNDHLLFPHQQVLEWCEHHKNDPLPPATDANDATEETRRRNIDISEWDGKFIQVDQEMLFEIILAANYLDIKPLLDLGCKTVANMIKGKTPEEIRKLFNIQNDFTPEEEAQIKRENEWAEEYVPLFLEQVSSADILPLSQPINASRSCFTLDYVELDFVSR
jgi:hypothetical protein